VAQKTVRQTYPRGKPLRLRNILILLVIFLALGGYFYFSNRPEPAPPPETQLFVWLVEMEEIQHIEIQLPHEDKSQAFIKIEEEDKFPWYFDNLQRSEVDTQRWGGGIPLLLSGPGANRAITENATEEELTKFGLTQPQMKITLTMENGDTVYINVGDSTPDGRNFFVQAPDTNDVATVDILWYKEIERLVKEPPYALPSAD
tara:strand:- start:147 stop:752 length:606 start_codon:yes stop_codon:yes gene_type:complete